MRMTPEPPEADLAGLDALDIPVRPAPGRVAHITGAAVPKLGGAGLVLLLWQGLVWTHLKPDYVLPGPVPVLHRMVADLADGSLPTAMLVTMRRAALGYGLAVALGVLVGLAVSRNRFVRSAVGSLITGLQTMPTIAWFPLAILFFGLSETAITFVVVLGAAPAIANGLISGIDHIPPLLLRAGRVLGARGLTAYRHVVLPAALPGLVGGLKQGWAFAWRSLMAGELIVIIAKRPSLGVKLQLAREASDAEGLLAAMVLILLIGMAVDGLVFARIERAVRSRWGLAIDDR